MKSQLVFEFLIAGIVFFAILFFAINYLNSNVSSFRENSYQNYLQNKAIEISEILMSENSSFSVVNSTGFDQNKIVNFNNIFCKTDGGYKKMLRSFNLYKEADSIQIPCNIKITITIENDDVLLDCGPTVPRNVQRAEVTRINIYDNKIAKLNVVIW